MTAKLRFFLAGAATTVAIIAAGFIFLAVVVAQHTNIKRARPHPQHASLP